MKVVRVHTMKAYKGVEFWLHLFLSRTLDGGDSQLYSPAAFLWERTPVRRLGGSQSKSGRFGIEKNLVCFAGF